MSVQIRNSARLALVLAVSVAAQVAVAQSNIIAYGVTANGALFRFDPDLPAVATPIGNLGIVPEAIDFRPTTIAGDPNRPLYAIDIGETTSQLYTVNTANAAVTPVGAAFPTTVAGSYDLAAGNQRYGFDFNPTTLMADNSIRIRLTSTSGENLRLNSDTGAVTVDTDLLNADATSPFVDGSAYINSNVATNGGTTTLFAMDTRTDRLAIQNPANAGTLNPVGFFGATIDANAGLAFDIYTDPSDADTGIGGDRGFAALTRTATNGGAYLLYDVNLATGAITNGRLVGGGLDFTGGLAVTYGPIPEPASLALAGLSCGAALAIRTRRR